MRCARKIHRKIPNKISSCRSRTNWLYISYKTIWWLTAKILLEFSLQSALSTLSFSFSQNFDLQTKINQNIVWKMNTNVTALHWNFKLVTAFIVFIHASKDLNLLDSFFYFPLLLLSKNPSCLSGWMTPNPWY